MPTLFKMSDDKKTEDRPTVVFTETPIAVPPRKTKKYVIIAVSAILAMGIILAAILVGMYMFTQAQKEIVQFTLQLNSNSKQDVTSDPNENVVQYHISSPGQDSWIISDFNRDIQVVKVVRNGETNCYLSALNRSNVLDPSKINGPDTTEPTDTISLMYEIADTPILDSSFLGKTASAACQGIFVYWLYPFCGNGNGNNPTNGTSMNHQMKKRQTYVNDPPFYCESSTPFNGSTLVCYTGCCQTVCSCNVTYTYSVSGSPPTYYCHWAISFCPPQITRYTVDGPCIGPSGLSCAATKNATKNCNPYC